MVIRLFDIPSNCLESPFGDTRSIRKVGVKRKSHSTVSNWIAICSVKFCNSTLNSGRIIRPDPLPTAPVLRTFVPYLIAFCRQTEASSDVITCSCARPILPNKCKKYLVM